MAGGVTREEVFKAADALLMRGERPTIERVRLEIGRGSPNTVSPMLNEWFGTLRERLAGRTTPGPEPLPPALLQAVRSVVHEAQREGSRLIAVELESLDVARNALQQQKAAMDAAEAARASLLEDLRTQLSLAAEHQAATQRALDERSAEVTAANRLAEAERQRSQALEGQLQSSAAAAAEERKRLLEQYSAAEKRLLQQVDDARLETKKVRQQLTALHQELEEQAVEQTQRVAELTQGLSASEARRRELEVQALERDTRLQEMQRANQALQDQMQQQAATTQRLLERMKVAASKAAPPRARNRAARPAG